MTSHNGEFYLQVQDETQTTPSEGHSTLDDGHQETVMEVLKRVKEEQDISGVCKLFLSLETPTQELVFEHLELEQQEAIVHTMEEQGQIADLEAVLLSLPATVRLYLLQHHSTAELHTVFSVSFYNALHSVIEYPAESVGQIVSHNYVVIHPHWTVRRVRQYLRSKRVEVPAETSVIYVADKRSWRLIGKMQMRDVLCEEGENIVEDVMDRDVISIGALEDRENTVMIMKFYHLLDIPVINPTGELVNTVNIKQVMQVLEMETTEDIQRGSLVQPLKTNYSETHIFRLYFKRVIWLSVLVFVNLGSSSVIAAFEETLEATLALAFFIPLLIDTGGNTGSQSSTLVIRALVTKDIELRDILPTLLKETFVGTLLGVTLGALGLGMGFIRGGLSVSIVVGITMVLIVLLSNFVGTSLPFILSLLRLDPTDRKSVV